MTIALVNCDLRARIVPFAAISSLVVDHFAAQAHRQDYPWISTLDSPMALRLRLHFCAPAGCGDLIETRGVAKERIGVVHESKSHFGVFPKASAENGRCTITRMTLQVA